MKISVVIPTHDRPKELGDALASVLHQKGGPWDLEVLVVGDDTDDTTVGMMRSWSAADQRVHFVNLPRQQYPDDPQERWCVLGLEARNWGYDNATGDYIAGLDDDDLWLPDWLPTMVPEIERLGVDVVYGRSTAYRDRSMQEIVGRYGMWPPQHFAFCDGAWLAKHDLGYRLDPGCIKRGLPEDGDKIDRMVAGGVSFAFVDKVIHHYFPEPAMKMTILVTMNDGVTAEIPVKGDYSLQLSNDVVDATVFGDTKKTYVSTGVSFILKGAVDKPGAGAMLASAAGLIEPEERDDEGLPISYAKPVGV